MAFDRAAEFHAIACGALYHQKDLQVTPGEKAILWAILSQNEILMGIAETLADPDTDPEAREELKHEFAEAEDSMASASILTFQRFRDS